MCDKGYLALSDGSVYEGVLIGTKEISVGEVVFNTSMTGYQEILTDPSYFGQIVMLTYPLIGNYGVNALYNESDRSWVKGFIVNELADDPSNWSSEGALNDFLVSNRVAGLTGVDVRAITRKTRETGTMNGMILNRPPEKADFELIKEYKIVNPVKEVSSTEVITIKGSGQGNVAVIDLGVKRNIINCLLEQGFDLTLYPYDTPAEEILKSDYQGLVLTNGPGDPKDNGVVIDSITKLLGKLPIFGICMGHQLIALACGGDTYKMKYGHRGGNHPVKDLDTGEIYITSQNHGYAVDNTGIQGGRVKYINLNDNTLEGIDYQDKAVFTVQFHPEAAAGPNDSKILYERFKQMINSYKGQ
ncbi:MAG: carbamoyl phosphate synthase small subunit [Christensenellales bacterium]|jgi:carbamoyl-phosphate synthase small subunit